MIEGKAEYTANRSIEVELPAAPPRKPTKVGRIMTALKKTLQKYRRDHDGQVFMSSNFKFDS